jgi:PIN domain nuclease of toxin-antitoxin system
MRVLIDTHVFLWFIAGDNRLSKRVRHLIERPDNEVLLSIASVWEIAIKTSIGKLTMSEPFDELIPEQVVDNEIEMLAIHLDDLKLVATLPLHHRDPFDRLIISQAITQGIPLASDDANFDQYNVVRLW